MTCALIHRWSRIAIRSVPTGAASSRTRPESRNSLQAAWNIKDEKQAWEAIDRGIEDATALYKLDADEDSPNLALREYWPSTQAYRRIVSCATRLFGVDAEPLLLKIRDPDLALLAQIEMASTLLGKPGHHSNTMISRTSRKK